MIDKIVQTPTNAIANSLDFYARLNFQAHTLEDKSYVSDKGVAIEINKQRTARAGVKMYKSSWEQEVKSLSASTHIIKTDEGHLLASPSGCWIYLIEGSDGLALDLSDQSSLLGNIAGVSFESININTSIEFWEQFGFKISMGGADHGWVAMSDDKNFTISVMAANSCPHLFFNPSLTYFNGKENNPKVIQAIRDAGVPIAEEVTAFNKEGIVDNVILKDPGGLGFFIFND